MALYRPSCDECFVMSPRNYWNILMNHFDKYVIINSNGNWPMTDEYR